VTQTVFLPAVNALDASGIFVSSAAGNTGYYGCATVTDPLAIYADFLRPGSVNSSGTLSAFSSMGPVIVDGSGRVKPDVAAPGEEIVSSFPSNTYQSASGTSFAGPHVAGVVALMWSANPHVDRTTRDYQAIIGANHHTHDTIHPSLC